MAIKPVKNIEYIAAQFKSEIVRCQMKFISILDMQTVRTRIVYYQNANQIVHDLVCRLYTYM